MEIITSYFHLLPEEIVNEIYREKHRLESQPVFATIRFELSLNNESDIAKMYTMRSGVFFNIRNSLFRDISAFKSDFTYCDDIDRKLLWLYFIFRRVLHFIKKAEDVEMIKRAMVLKAAEMTKLSTKPSQNDREEMKQFVISRLRSLKKKRSIDENYLY